MTVIQALSEVTVVQALPEVTVTWGQAWPRVTVTERVKVTVTVSLNRGDINSCTHNLTPEGSNCFEIFR